MNSYNVVKFCIIISNTIISRSLFFLDFKIDNSLSKFFIFFLYDFTLPLHFFFFFLTLFPSFSFFFLSIICITVLLSPSNFLSSFNLINRQTPLFLSRAPRPFLINEYCEYVHPCRPRKQECGGVWPIRAKLS